MRAKWRGATAGPWRGGLILFVVLALALGCGGGLRLGRERRPPAREPVARPEVERPQVPVAPPVDAVYPGATWESWPRPEDAGWSSAGLVEARKYAEEIGSDAVFAVYAGRVLCDWGKSDAPTQIHSVRKSLLSALIGIAVSEGKINLDATMKELGIDDNEPSLTEEEKTATVRMLLCARSGVYHPALAETPGMRARRPERGSHPPGTFWYYNNWDFNVLGTILENARGGTSLFVDFAERIAKPLQMEDFALRYCRYQRGGDSIHPAYIFRMSARDLARFGLLYLRRGAWNGRQIVPADWVAESLVSYSNAGRGGYGYMWWVSRQGRLIGNLELPGEHFAAQGNKGQIIFVYPQLDLVVVHRVDSRIPGKEIPNSQIGELLRRIIAARAS